MHPLTRQPEDLSASLEPRPADAHLCEQCTSEASLHEVGSSGAAPTFDADAVTRQEAEACTEGSAAGVDDNLPAIESLAGRRWYVSEDRLVGVDVTEAVGDVRASAVPFTVDGKDLFQYEDGNKVRLELGGASSAAALACALGFLRARYPSLRPAVAAEIPAETHALHQERLVVRFNEWIEATTAEITDMEALSEASRSAS
ncbi:MAG: hypothetical protein LC791_17185 [Acidobacteria bacterium]|nr:hypothetical protein [Acidobacteriota bacterium]